MANSNNRVFDDPELKISLNFLFSIVSRFSRILYLIIISFLIILAFGMVYFEIPVYIQARGIIRPIAEVNQIISPVQGIISDIKVNDNQHISRGQVIIQLESEKEVAQKKLIVNELNIVRSCISDLAVLTEINNPTGGLQTEKYQFDYQLYSQSLTDIDLKIDQAKTEYFRLENLFKEKYISKKEFEESVLKYNSLLVHRKQLVSEKHKQWINEIYDFRTKEKELVNQISELSFYLDKSIVTAPVSGIIQGIRSKYKGEYCSAGTTICNLIPDTGLVAIVYLPPKDIGNISSGQNLRLLIDSYDYKYWGALGAECTMISNDIEIIENQPFFRVSCNFQPFPRLEYRNIKVDPANGMTLTAQFLVAEKNLWQLLRDQAYYIVSKDRSSKQD